jgi:hypothetical protein
LSKSDGMENSNVQGYFWSELVEIESFIERLILSKIDTMEKSVEGLLLSIIHANGIFSPN